jgi:hypothetical protein
LGLVEQTLFNWVKAAFELVNRVKAQSRSHFQPGRKNLLKIDYSLL